MVRLYKTLENIVKKYVAKPLVVGGLVGVLGFGNLVYGNEYNNEILVNTYTENYQGMSDIAMDEKGNVIITWESLYQDGSLLGVYAQRFNKEMKTDEQLGEEIQVNSYTENHQHKPKIAIDKEGNFVITWESQADWRIHAQRFNKDGTPIENEFRVSPTESEQRHPRIAMDGQGNFLVALRYGQYGPAYAQRFDRNGDKRGEEFGIDGYESRIAMDPNGNFITTGAGDGALYAQRYDRNGNTLGDSLLVSLSKADGSDPEIGDSSVALNDNEFIVTWKDYGGVYARRFDKDGSEIGEEFQVNTCTEEDQILPDVAMDKEGKFVITWTSWNGSAAEIYAQRFDKDRNKIGKEFRVNNYSLEAIHPPLIEGYPGNSSIVMNYYNSDFIISWEGAGKEDDYGIYAKKFSFYNPADLDKDGYVNFKDFAKFANDWQKTREGQDLEEGEYLIGDINKYGKVDYSDLERLINNWLAYYP